MTAPAALYLDTSAVLRVILESGMTPEIEDKIAAVPILLTSRLSQVEAGRALLRVRSLRTVSEARLADAAGLPPRWRQATGSEPSTRCTSRPTFWRASGLLISSS